MYTRHHNLCSCAILLVRAWCCLSHTKTSYPNSQFERGISRSSEKTIFENHTDNETVDPESSSAITMKELAAIHRRTQTQDYIHLELFYEYHPHEEYSYFQTSQRADYKDSPSDEIVNINKIQSISPLESAGSLRKQPQKTPAPTSHPSPFPSPIPPRIQPLRIVFETTELDLVENPDTQNDIHIIKEEILPAVAKTWSSILSVVPVTKNIPIPQNVCNGFFPNVPSNVEENGVQNADIVIFVSGASVISGKKLCGPRTLASASFCNLDQFDRPSIGFINFCLDNLHGKEVEKLVKIGVHEMAHILGWNDDLFKYFRDRETGEPLTMRPFQSQNVECVNGSTRNIELPGSRTIQMKEEMDKGLNSSGKTRISYELVTPAIRQVVRNQFGCQNLDGAKLENQPTNNSCIGAHFDERFFFTEVMGPIFSSTLASALSPLSIALLEDTGFYHVRYSSPYVQNSAFGLGAGCDFVTESCVDKKTDQVMESFKPYFCDSVTKFDEDGIDSSSESTCDPTFSSIAYCDLFDFSNDVPDGFTVPDNDATQYFSNSALGVIFSHADYCPVPAVLKLDCTNESNFSFQKVYPGEEYGRMSKCFNTQYHHPEKGGMKTGACLKSSCNEQEHHLEVYIDGEKIVCEFDGQVHEFPRTLSASFECPPLRSVCPDLFCPGLCSGKGVCNFESRPPKCDCFDEDDDSDGCYGKDYLADTVAVDKKSNENENAYPNSAWSKGRHITALCLLMALCIII